MEDTNPPLGPELVFGLVGALGSPMEAVADALGRGLDRVGYRSSLLRLSDALTELAHEYLGSEFAAPAPTEATRIERAMRAGTALRSSARSGRPMAWLAVSRIRAERGPEPATDRRAFILRSLKHPDELAELRRIYGARFVAVGIHAPRDERVRVLARRFAEDVGGTPEEQRSEAERLISIDEKEPGTELGQNVRKAFPEADLFVTSTSVDAQVDRFIDLFFGRPVVTPSADEVGMFHAHAAAVRSAALGRQVGAAIATPQGDVIATGCNEVPRAGGGQYWDGELHDGRDFRLGRDQSDRGKRNALRELLRVLADAKHLAPGSDVERLVGELLARGSTSLPETAIANLTEFTRDVHAEAAALLTAARLGISVQGRTLYATTFPCHNCAKHIIGAGLARVVYREPYPKSYARDFYQDSIEVEGERRDRVSFQPFIGVAPRRYLEWFAMSRPRKDADGRLIGWRAAAALPAFGADVVDTAHRERETEVIDALARVLQNVDAALQSRADRT